MLMKQNNVRIMKMPTIKRKHIKLKRNSICPCDENMELEEGDQYKRGKRKKYKHCCLPKMVLQEQRAAQMINDNKEIEGMKKNVAAAIQFDADHPIILPNDNLCLPGNGGSDIILP